MLRLQGTEKGLLRTKNLNSTGRMFRQVEQATSMSDQPCANKFSNEGRQIRCNGVHSISEIFSELCSVRRYRDDLVAEGVDMGNVRIRNFCPHGDLGGGFEDGLQIFGKDGGE